MFVSAIWHKISVNAITRPKLSFILSSIVEILSLSFSFKLSIKIYNAWYGIHFFWGGGGVFNISALKLLIDVSTKVA